MASKDRESYEEERRLIRKAMAEHKLVLFVGSGTSLDAGMPSWSSAVYQIAQKLQIHVNDADMLKIPQYYYNLYGQHNYTKLMRKIFKYDTPLHPGRVHNLILRFNADTIITTNYDHLLEQAAENNGKILHAVADDTELPYTKGNKLIKMHGDFEHGNFVLKENDYLNYTQNFKLINNYITSLAGTNLLLFVGYSFSDPDVKQIISWLKNALGNDLQQAYMISVSPVEKVIDDYFKKFGINIIYAQDIAIARRKENISKTETLEEALQWILDDDNRTDLENLYQRLGSYRYLDMPYVTDVKQILSYRGFNVEELTPSKGNSAEKVVPKVECRQDDANLCGQQENNEKSKCPFIKELLKIQRPYVVSNPLNGNSHVIPTNYFEQKDDIPCDLTLFLKFCYVADQQAGNYKDAGIIRKQQWYRMIDESYRKIRPANYNDFYFISRNEYKEIEDIIIVMRKCGFAALALMLSDADMSEQSNKDESEHSLSPYLIPLQEFNHDDRMEMAIDCFDYEASEEMEQECENWVSHNNPDMLLKQAHNCYFLGNYLKAYHLSKMAAYEYYRLPNYAKYFIAKCDQYYLGRAVIHHWIINDEDTRKVIESEINQIDLDQLFSELPDLSGNFIGFGKENQFLKDLYSFNLAYKILQDTVKKADKTKEEAESSYISYFGEPEYKRLRKQIAEFYFYQQGNHFLVDDYSEVQEIYKVAISSLLSSVIVKDRHYKGDGISPNPILIFNIHEKELLPFDILLTVRFSSAEDINRILDGSNLVPVSEAGIKYLELLTENLSKEPEAIRGRRNYFRTVLALCGYITLSPKLAGLAIKTIIDRLTHDVDGIRALAPYAALINYFMDNLYQQSWISTWEKCSELLYQLVDALVALLHKDMVQIDLDNIIDLCEHAYYILRKCGIAFDHVQTLNSIFNSDADMNTKVNLALHIYAFGSSKIQQSVKNHLSGWVPGKDVRGCFLSFLGIESGAYSNVEQMEANCFSLLESYQQEFAEHLEKGNHYSVDNKYIDLIYDLVRLELSGKLSDKERLKKICRAYRVEAACWLLDTHDEESFAKFEPRWLKICDRELLEQFSSDTGLKKGINIRMKEEYEKGNLDDYLVKLYFKYFS